MSVTTKTPAKAKSSRKPEKTVEISHIPNAETAKVIEEARAGKNLAPVTLEGLRKMWDDA